jgi:TRAP-type C4-dicarboxylate transport system substrate-binding protein
MMRFATRFVGLLASVALVVSATAALAQQQPIMLKFSHYLPPQHPVSTQVLMPWCQKIEAESAARLKCQIYPAMQLGGTPLQVFDQVRDGIADLGHAVLGYNPGRFPLIDVFELPFMARSGESHSVALQRFIEKYAAKDFASVRLIAAWSTDGFQIHSRREVKTLENLKGLKIRSGLKTGTRIFELLGATPISIPMTGTTEALSKGVLDATFIPWDSVPALKIHELVSFHSEFASGQPALHTANLVLIMNKAKYDSLPPELKKVIDDNSGVSVAALGGRVFDTMAANGRKIAAARGNSFYEMSADEIARWKKLLEPMYADWIKEVSAKGHDGQKLFDAAQKLIAAAAAEKN